MQPRQPLMLLLALSACAGLAVAAGSSAGNSPLQKVQQLLSDQATKISKEGEEAKKVQEEYAKWCDGRAKELEFEIKTGESDVNEQQSVIDAANAVITSLTTKVEELVAAIATQEKELQEATEVRSKDAADFAAEEKELTQILDMLKRAVTIIQREAQKGGSLVQLQGVQSLTDALGLMVQASVFSAADADRLTALLQSTRAAQAADASAGDEDLSLGAPQAAAYEGHSQGIVQTLRDMQDKAEGQLDEARKRETKNLHAFELLKQALEDQTRLAKKDLAEAQNSIAENGQKKSVAEGALTAASNELASDRQALEDVQHDCMARAADYEAEAKEREEELKVIAEAKQIIAETTSGAAESTYALNQVSLLQLRSRRQTSSVAGQLHVVRMVRNLARETKSVALEQLAGRLDAAASMGAEAGTANPFGKVKDLISEMIERLQAEAEADATQKAFCDKEMAETQAKHDGKTTEASKLATKIEQQSARSAQLKEEVAVLQSSLAALASSQAEMDKIRQEEHALFVAAKADLQQGIEGVKRALQVLRDYYGVGEKAAGGAGGSIIGLLEVVESDFSKGLAEAVAAEESAQAAYTKQTNDNQLEKAGKEKDVEYKNKESAELDKSVSESKSDLTNVEAELVAIGEYFDKIKEQCVAKPEAYEERAARRETEIAGLKEALQVLESEASLLQTSARRALRGVSLHRQA